MILITSILEEFAYDNLSSEAQPFHRSSEYSEAMQLLTRNEGYFLEKLNEKEKILFEKYIDVQDELDRLTAAGNLIYDYRLGITMTAEVFIGMDNSLQHGENR